MRLAKTALTGGHSGKVQQQLSHTEQHQVRLRNVFLGKHLQISRLLELLDFSFTFYFSASCGSKVKIDNSNEEIDMDARLGKAVLNEVVHLPTFLRPLPFFVVALFVCL